MQGWIQKELGEMRVQQTWIRLPIERELADSPKACHVTQILPSCLRKSSKSHF